MASITLLPACHCGARGAESGTRNGLPVLACRACGVLRQDVPLTSEQYAAWYHHDYFDGVYYHTPEQDARVAALRADRYAVPSGASLLDVGCGTGAFVTECRDRGVNAVGQDVAAQSGCGEYVYVGDLQGIHFPTEAFDVVTIHDVLEHLTDPLATLQEVRRILKQGGTLWLDFPRFHHPCGRHHWKATEHLWLLDEPQLVALLEAAGLLVRRVEHPIPSKVLIQAVAPEVRRPSILVPAGIGDSYWVMVKLRAFLAREGLGMPDVYVQDSGGPKRTEPYLRCLPFVHAAGYKQLDFREPLWREAYLQNGRTVFPDVFGVDYFLAYNGVMRFGASLSEADPDLACEWYPPMHVSLEARAYRRALEADGPYVVAYFTDSGMYQHWLKEFPVERLTATLHLLRHRGYRIVLIGAPWDDGKTGSQLARRDPAYVDLVGQTSFDQMLGALMGASGVVGFPAGNTILATTLRVPTVLLWNRYFDARFWMNACPPDATEYHAIDTATATADGIASLFPDVSGRKAAA